MVTLRAFEALFAGLATAILLALAMKSLLKRLAPDWARANAVGFGPLSMNLGFSFLSAAAGGYVTAWTAEGNPLAPVLMLGVIVLLLTALSALQGQGKRPLKYEVALAVISPAGVVAGGLVRLRVLGVL